ncbi:IS200/IS605 family transposase [Alkalitalea saponilacus]|uniref:REP element-mobilizing transposase RayT n=1 Tax=Alkalitalea saponilacus TaxID=889453 RepID=A0A1T5HSH7_9BACT|nr:IS200/IS605 family transposase [Alkalitalea saponilacus]ASB47700.1 transposase [Alkalitalea saponilacus]SKC23625.1 REP element-mobilizing transposase RayT [Alkalitalea saponilacus]
MANTYTQLYVQYVFTVKGKENLIRERFRIELEKVICGIISNQKSKTYAIYCNPDHTHILVGIHPIISVSKLVEQIKSGSSNWLNNKKYIHGFFSWQDGYGAFTYSKSHIDKVVKYILNQPEHHKKQSFKDEYLNFLKKFDVEYDPKYLFDWHDNE